jgi:hypothetical protein
MKRLGSHLLSAGAVGSTLALILWASLGAHDALVAGTPGSEHAAAALPVLQPWRWPAGADFTNLAAAAAFVTIGFLLSAGLLAWAARRWFADLGAGWRSAGLLAIGAGNYALSLLENPTRDAMAMAGGYMAGLVALASVVAALRSRSRRSLGASLAVMSAACGLAAAFRPIWMFALWVPAGITVVLARRSASLPGRRPFHRWLLFGCGWLPAIALCTVLLLRGGFHIGDATAPHAPAGMAVLGSWLFSPPGYDRFFPFLQAPVDRWGLLWCAPLALLGLAFPLSLLRCDLRRDSTWILGVGFAWSTAFSILLARSLAPGADLSDPGDFLPLLLWPGILVLFALAQTLRRGPAVRRLAAGVLGAMVALTVAHNAMLLCARYAQPDRLRPLARLVNRPVGLIERWCGVRYGPIAIRLLMPYVKTHPVEPLVVTGQGRDTLLIKYLGNDTAQVVFDHTGHGGPSSAPFRLVLGRAYEFMVQMGSLFPPRDHPFLAGCSDELVEALHHTVLVTVNGHVLLDAGSDFYPTRPSEVHVGSNPLGLDSALWFTGEIVSVGRPGLAALGPWRESVGGGPVRLTLRLPAFTAPRREPLISTGRTGAGDLIYIEYVGPHEIRFGHDDWGGGAATTRTVTYDPSAPQVLEVDYPSLHSARAPEPPVPAPLTLRFNGQLLWCVARPTLPSRVLETYFGFNRVRASAVKTLFTGEIASVERIPQMLPRLNPVEAGDGPLLLEVLLPRDRPQRSEPLLVSGRPGAGDLVYIHYTDDQHVQFGLDHWLAGGPLSPPVAVDYARLQSITISTGALYPPVEAAAWGSTPAAQRQAARQTMAITMNDHVVLSCPLVPYDVTPGEIYVGRNPIGGSSCDPAFSGSILTQIQTGAGPPAASSILAP